MCTATRIITIAATCITTSWVALTIAIVVTRIIVAVVILVVDVVVILTIATRFPSHHGCGSSYDHRLGHSYYR